jgi:putative DNA primase/helicase
VPWTVTIPEHDRDKALTDKLRTEWPGILAWAVEGCHQWQRGGLQEPREVTEATDRYRAEQDTLAAFLAERCTIGRDFSVRAGALREAYEKWSSETVTRNAFATRMESKGFRSETGSGGYQIYRGIGLQS